MNLDDQNLYNKIDADNMLSHIDNLPAQLEAAWELGMRLDLPDWKCRRVLIQGMGGSAISADLLTAYSQPICRVPVIVNRDYDLPRWAMESDTLVIASSHSGETEETLSGYEQALSRGCATLAITTNGALSSLATSKGALLWKYEYRSQPRAALGYLYGLLLAVFTRLELIPDPLTELEEAVKAMRQAQPEFKTEVPVARNPAKRVAGQLMGRFVITIGSGCLAPVARRLKNQINELAKASGQFECLPEADHNFFAGFTQPEDLLSRIIVLILRAPSDHPRNRLRGELTQKSLMLQGVVTNLLDAKGNNRLTHQLTMLHFCDYVAYYLALAYGVDPTLTQQINKLKEDLKRY